MAKNVNQIVRLSKPKLFTGKINFSDKTQGLRQKTGSTK